MTKGHAFHTLSPPTFPPNPPPQTKVAAAIGGGYNPDHAILVERHVRLHQAAAEYWGPLSAACQARRVARRAAWQRG
jgi:hypothetical protein